VKCPFPRLHFGSTIAVLLGLSLPVVLAEALL
jgi:hypothetical protein